MKTKINISGTYHKGLPKLLQNKKFATISNPVTHIKEGKGFMFFKFGKSTYVGGAVQGGSYGGKVFSYIKRNGIYHIKMQSMNTTSESVFKIKNHKLYYLYNDSQNTKYLTIYKYQVKHLGI